mmetsp:Transcript_41061/g.128151  ORF Transcript_41061/g.128151 Transcript_41061/m.128151 type:complete len:290 (+) Transcript_41061:141-1010(+)
MTPVPRPRAGTVAAAAAGATGGCPAPLAAGGGRFESEETNIGPRCSTRGETPTSGRATPPTTLPLAAFCAAGTAFCCRCAGGSTGRGCGGDVALTGEAIRRTACSGETVRRRGGPASGEGGRRFLSGEMRTRSVVERSGEAGWRRVVAAGRTGTCANPGACARPTSTRDGCLVTSAVNSCTPRIPISRELDMRGRPTAASINRPSSGCVLRLGSRRSTSESGSMMLLRSCTEAISLINLRGSGALSRRRRELLSLLRRPVSEPGSRTPSRRSSVFSSLRRRISECRSSI